MGEVPLYISTPPTSSRPVPSVERRKGDQLLQLRNRNGRRGWAPRQNADGPWRRRCGDQRGCDRICRRRRGRGLHSDRSTVEPRTGEKAAIEALWSQGRAMTQRSKRCGAQDRRGSSDRGAVELKTNHDAALRVLLSQGRATDTGRPSGCAGDERAQRLIGWAEKPKDYMINRLRGA